MGVDYYTYHVGNLTRTNTPVYMEIIKYFLSIKTSKFHDRLVRKFLYRLKHRKLSKPLQSSINQCLEIIDTTSNNNAHLAYFYHFLLTCPPKQLIPYCLSNIYNLLDKQSFVNKTVQGIITSHKFAPLKLNIHHHKRKFIIFFISILLHHKHSSKIFKALLIMCNDPFISHISMNSC